MSITDLETQINDWVASNARWEDDSVEHILSERNTEMDGSGETYFAIDVRFLLDYSKSNLEQKFVDKLQNKVAWYRIGFHSCTHDGPSEIGEVTGEAWTANHETPVSLAHDRLQKGTVAVHTDNETVFDPSNYTVNARDGEITADSSGDLVDGENYRVSYSYYKSGGPCWWDDSAEWVAKDVTIPTGVPTFDVSA